MFSEPAGYTTAYCHTKLAKLQVFCQKKFDTRLKFFEKLILEDFDIGGECNVHYKLIESINFPDLPECTDHYNEFFEEKYDEWFDKAKEVINKYKSVE